MSGVQMVRVEEAEGVVTIRLLTEMIRSPRWRPRSAALLLALTAVTTTPRVEGAWHWVNDRKAHWRPREYYAPNAAVRPSRT